ncbi:hypothetical protein Pla175_49430 [Pirellulimonas nuda]|uniref:Uncharacterized protein n=1 Tax=Pirellulimonas nuda TaxID=2528009 RepID=A0A518DJ50_9BACT|nr:hypothetical protein [Pirellulimonas nuda]QDU91514.1 hypothetical protein Pla175_49430 [Pirellulimonas nuda]
MNAEQVESLKQQLTDQFVTVDPDRPELARFRGLTGRVKTVNMNGRALVEFDGYVKNIGWFDIAPQCLTVVSAPAGARAAQRKAPQPKLAQPKPAGDKPKPPTAKTPAPASGEKKLSPLELARRQGGAGTGGSAAEKPAAKPPAARPAEAKTGRPEAAAKYVTPPPPATMINQPPRVLNRRSLTAADILEMSQGKMPSLHQPAPTPARSGSAATAPKGATAKAAPDRSTPSVAVANAAATANDPAAPRGPEPAAPTAGATQPEGHAAATSSDPPPAAAGKPSTADILAACRSKAQE